MEFDHNGLGVGVSGVVNEVSELVQVVTYRPLPLEVGCGLQGVDSHGLGVEG